MDKMNLAEAVLSGNRLALSRLITKVENQDPEGLAALDDLFFHTGRAHLIGITGSPGSGKSSLVNQLVLAYRKKAGSTPLKVAVVAVDPTSPFSGGALLGDRVRMRDLMADPDVFIRSMASRGALGGLAHTTASVVQVLDAAGFDKILIETVGAGQTEVDIARLAHTVIVVEAPGMGDEIQAIKAGILEIADILVVNKSDQTGVENTVRAFRSMLELARPDMQNPMVDAEGNQHGDLSGKNRAKWIPRLVQTIATLGTGTGELLQTIQQHLDYLGESQERERRDRERLLNEFDRLLRSALVECWRAETPELFIQQVIDRLTQRKITPQQAVKTLISYSKVESN